MKYLLILFTCFSLSSFGQNHYTALNIHQLTDTIKEFGILHSEYTGLIDSTSKSYLLYDALRKVASQDDLMRLSKHNNAVIKTYALSVRCQQINVERELRLLLFRLNRDTTTVKVQFGEKAFDRRISHFLRTVYVKHYNDFKDLSIQQLTDSLAYYNGIYSSHTGIGGTPSKVFPFFEVLRDKASTKELLELINHDSAAVRCYTFWALRDRKAEGLFGILLENLDDTTKVYRHAGCVISNISVADFYIKMYNKNALPPFKEIKILDSIVIHQHHQLTYLEDAFSRYSPKQSDYELIKSLVLAQNYFALPALARYQKEEDLALIMSFKDFQTKKWRIKDPECFFFEAIEEFPHNYFKAYLDQYSSDLLSSKYLSSIQKEFYTAVASYDDEFSNTILNRPFTYKNGEKLKYHIAEINYALGKHPSSNHQELMIKLWKEHQHLTLESFEYLKEARPELTAELVITLLTNYKSHVWACKESLLTSDELIEPLLIFLSQYNKEAAIKILIQNLETASAPIFMEFTKVVDDLKDRRIANTLISKLAKNNYKKVCTHIIEILVSNYDMEIYQEKILKAIEAKNVDYTKTFKEKTSELIRNKN